MTIQQVFFVEENLYLQKVKPWLHQNDFYQDKGCASPAYVGNKKIGYYLDFPNKSLAIKFKLWFVENQQDPK